MTADAILDAVRPHVEAGAVPGAVVGVLDAEGTSLAAAGDLRTDAVVRISSNTKPLVAALALVLIEDGVLSLDTAVQDHLPELEGQRVLRRPGADLEDTVAADRPATVEDLLTMRLGFGHVLDGESPAVRAATEGGLGFGPPDPSGPFDPDEWIARFAGLPLLDQPGTTWRYELSFAVLGVLLARATGTPLDRLLRERVTQPLGMADTDFRAPPSLPPAYRRGEGDDLVVFDAGGADSRWVAAPAFPDACGGLVSTATDLLRFADVLLSGGASLLSEASVAAMTADALTDRQRTAPSAAPFLDGGGWGYGLGIAERPGLDGVRYGWAGGFGTLWWSWPAYGTSAVLLTQVMPPAAPVFDAFTTAVEDALRG